MAKRRTYTPRIVGGQVTMPADLKRLHKYLFEMERIEAISDKMRDRRLALVQKPPSSPGSASTAPTGSAGSGVVVDRSHIRRRPVYRSDD
jgi:hypothetical protein